MDQVYYNQQAQDWRPEQVPDPALQHIQAFHHSLPNFRQTPLVSLSSLAQELGVRGVFVKDESSRLELPAFKILGASWGTFRAICDRANLPVTTSSLADAAAAAKQRTLTLYAATEGNHGRAVARMARILGVPARIYVPEFTSDPVRQNILSEAGTESDSHRDSHRDSSSNNNNKTVMVVQVPGDYDCAVAAAWRDSKAAVPSGSGLLIQDNAFPGYDQIPQYIVQGYSTMLAEVEQQLSTLNSGSLAPTMIVTPIGVGSLGHAVTVYAKSDGGDRSAGGSARGDAVSVLAVEPATAGCLHANLKAAKLANPIPIPTAYTIMDGLCCGTVSSTAWSTLQHGIDASLTITDYECHEALQYLHRHGVHAGPCGAASLAGLLELAHHVQDSSDSAAARNLLNKDAVIVLLCTEGNRWYKTPSAP